MEMHAEKKEDRTWAIVGTVAAVLLCGLPGLCLLAPAGIFILAHGFNYNSVGFEITPGVGSIFLCLAVIFIAIAVLVPVLTLRRKKSVTPPVEVLPPQDLPPAPPPPMPPEFSSASTAPPASALINPAKKCGALRGAPHTFFGRSQLNLHRKITQPGRPRTGVYRQSR